MSGPQQAQARELPTAAATLPAVASQASPATIPDASSQELGIVHPSQVQRFDKDDAHEQGDKDDAHERGDKDDAHEKGEDNDAHERGDKDDGHEKGEDDDDAQG